MHCIYYKKQKKKNKVVQKSIIALNIPKVSGPVGRPQVPWSLEDDAHPMVLTSRDRNLRHAYVLTNLVPGSCLMWGAPSPVWAHCDWPNRRQTHALLPRHNLYCTGNIFNIIFVLQTNIVFQNLTSCFERYIYLGFLNIIKGIVPVPDAIFLPVLGLLLEIMTAVITLTFTITPEKPISVRFRQIAIYDKNIFWKDSKIWGKFKFSEEFF